MLVPASMRARSFSCMSKNETRLDSFLHVQNGVRLNEEQIFTELDCYAMECFCLSYIIWHCYNMAC